MAPASQPPAQGGMEKKPKTIFQLDSSFTAAQWPQISPQNQDTILELLCSLLSPMGQHRASHIVPSKGKRAQKRKRKEANLEKGEETLPDVNSPPPPEISRFISVGLNSVTRSLESLSEHSRLESSEGTDSSEQEAIDKSSDAASPAKDKEGESSLPPPFSAIFVSRTSLPGILHAHLPQLMVTASLAHPNSPATRLVQLPASSEERLCQALGIPRVSFLGLTEGAPFSSSLVDLIRDCVAPVEIPWLAEVKAAKYLPVKINAIQTFASAPKKSKT